MFIRVRRREISACNLKRVNSRKRERARERASEKEREREGIQVNSL
jgi:hypothetical protein